MDTIIHQILHSRLGLSLLIILLSLGIGWLTRRLLGVMRDSPSSNDWLRSLGYSLYRPSFWLIVGMGFLLSAELTLPASEHPVEHALILRMRRLYLVVSFTWLLFLWKASFEKILLDRVVRKGVSGSEKALVVALTRLVSVAVAAVAGLMILDILEMPLSGLLAFGGVGALAISWAAKDVVANFFGGLMIYVNRPFTVGDWVKSPNKNFEGVVEQIGWYMTQIRSFERRPTYIPNALFLDAIIENPGRMYNRRIKCDIGLRYGDLSVCRAVRDGIEKMLRAHVDIDQRQILMVHFLEFGPYSLNINIYCFTKTTNWAEYRAIHQDVLLKAGQVVAEQGAEIAFPTRTLHVQNELPS